MENINQPTNVEPKREHESEIDVLNFSKHKELLQQFFDQESSESLNLKEKQLFVNKLKKSIAS